MVRKIVFFTFIGVCSLALFWECYSVGSNNLNPVFRAENITYGVPEDFDNFDNVSGTRDGSLIVPNYVHFVRFKQPVFTFTDAVCVLAALKNQKPDRIYFHTDAIAFRGKYWRYLLEQKSFRDAVRIVNANVPRHIFGQPLRWRVFHGGDIARIKILMEYGGIFLDNDTYVVKSLDTFRKYEITLGWMPGGNISNQAIIAHKNARFLARWLNSYKDAYDGNSWFYNAGVRPTQDILLKKPELIHRVEHYLVEHKGFIRDIFTKITPSWRNHYAIHLLMRHQYLYKNVTSRLKYPVVFDERNIKDYPVSFRDMVADVYPIL